MKAHLQKWARLFESSLLHHCSMLEKMSKDEFKQQFPETLRWKSIKEGSSEVRTVVKDCYIEAFVGISDPRFQSVSDATYVATWLELMEAPIFEMHALYSILPPIYEKDYIDVQFLVGPHDVELDKNLPAFIQVIIYPERTIG